MFFDFIRNLSKYIRIFILFFRETNSPKLKSLEKYTKSQVLNNEKFKDTNELKTSSAYSWFRIARDLRSENGIGSLDKLRVSGLLRDLRRCNRSQTTIYHRRNLHVGFAHETASNRLSKLRFPQQSVFESVHLQISHTIILRSTINQKKVPKR